MTLPTHGTWCTECLALGHRCQAQIFVEGVPSCLPCADAEPCAAMKAAGAGREGSTVATRLNVFLEEEGAAAPPVVHRTPEELGIARTVKDEPPPRPNISPDFGPTRISGPRRIKDVPRKTQTAFIRAGHMQSQQRPEEAEKAMTVTSGRKQGERVPDETKKKILAEPAQASHADLARKYGVSDVTVRKIRLKGGVKPYVAVQRRRTAPQRSITIDPRAHGTAAALLGALDRGSAPTATVKIAFELNAAEAERLIGSLTGEQKNAFLSAGIRAALLA